MMFIFSIVIFLVLVFWLKYQRRSPSWWGCNFKMLQSAVLKLKLETCILEFSPQIVHFSIIGEKSGGGGLAGFCGPEASSARSLVCARSRR